ncbi:MAG: PilZ domain-containing protein [Bryobacterales bacterium]|nr:PilZ domain-containing protein [Bryobacterales bacterium]
MIADRRREPRLPAQGAVWVCETAAGGAELEGELVDRSPEGFRAAFRQTAPSSGATVEFRMADSSGLAVAMWTRRAGTRVECGFHIHG